MRHDNRWLIGKALVLAAVTSSMLVSCGDESPEDHLREAVSPLEEDLGFEPILPSYLPEGTPPDEVQTRVFEENDEIFIILRRSEDPDIPRHVRPFIQIVEARKGGPFITAPGADHRSEFIMVDGQCVVMRTLAAEGKIEYFARLRGIPTILQFAWPPDDRGISEITPAMRDEGVQSPRFDGRERQPRIRANS